jgi:carboxymethylenebutenolidase
MKQEIRLKTTTEGFTSYVAVPESDKSKKAGKKYPGLILIHEIWGLDKHIKDVTERYAKEGFIVIAPDLFAGTGVVEKMSPAIFADLRGADLEKRHVAQAKMREIMQPLSTKEFSEVTMAKLRACYDYLSSEKLCTGSIGVLGFCFGGTYSFHLAAKEPAIKACVPFYGQPPQPLDNVAGISCPVLAFYGEKDENLMKSLPDLEAAMKKHVKDFTFKVYKNTGHAFFNDTNKIAFNKEARDDAWKLSLDFLHKNLG